MREFETGATRDTDEGKIDYWGFTSALAWERFGRYMMKHQKQTNGQMRASDNWKKGIPMDAYQRSLYRHMQEFKKAVETERPDEAEELACAMLFNLQGWLHERLKKPAMLELELEAAAGAKKDMDSEIISYTQELEKRAKLEMELEAEQKPAGMDAYVKEVLERMPVVNYVPYHPQTE